MQYLRNILIPLLLIIPAMVFGQFRSMGNKKIEADVFHGFILKHKPQIAHLITEHPTGFRISFDQKTYGSELWQQRYNFPDVGLTFVYVNYGDDRLGKSFAVIPHYTFYINKNKASKNQLKYKLGLGLGYNTEKYHKEYNNKNNVLGTDLNFGVILETEYQRELTDRFFLHLHVALTHFSNGSIKKPNSGINVVSSNLGVSYLINYQKTAYTYIEEEPVEEKGLGYTLTLSAGMHEYSKQGSGQYPFFVLSGLVDKRLNHKSALGITLEWFASLSMRNEIKYDVWLTDQEKPDWHRVGIALSHELFVNSVSLISQAGYYVYDEYNYFGKIYLRLGVRKYFNDHIYSSLVVKSHAAKAEAAEFALGWRFR
ncbi:hypothetical protein C900_02214 [Fulvivirga imtechensis AK7]|uniref:Deacylase n=1 Tax=Fulvivirga imtechensis AK7 TaxID=1237149 RepID=L8JW52_9BACT|nr:acyloxyacyl hydrolase [Fulvivirga imtechensis]ELR71839.1 hypothetical protein C900_02214 [Fulvivirga imtechensis AK7]